MTSFQALYPPQIILLSKKEFKICSHCILNSHRLRCSLLLRMQNAVDRPLPLSSVLQISTYTSQNHKHSITAPVHSHPSVFESRYLLAWNLTLSHLKNPLAIPNSSHPPHIVSSFNKGNIEFLILQNLKKIHHSRLNVQHLNPSYRLNEELNADY